MPQDPQAAPATSGRLENGNAISDQTNLLIVGVGASAGGLDACRKLLSVLPKRTGMAFILVQHLDPTHESMLVQLLAEHTALDVVEALDGAVVEPDHIYVIPPGAYLSVAAGRLHLTPPGPRHGARMPFDFLLSSLAAEYGENAAAIVLSGTGSDGSRGVEALTLAGGLAIAQTPEEAEFDGMPQNAIATGSIHSILPLAAIPQALTLRANQLARRRPASPQAREQQSESLITAIIELLHQRTRNDFRLYKRGTLQRRIERRMALAGMNPPGFTAYLELLQKDQVELEALAGDLLINVTAFFRDPQTFDYLETATAPQLVSEIPPGGSLRVWVAGCSTGEEAYSIGMLLVETITAAKANIKLQIFASDIDAEAVAIARHGLYPGGIETAVSKERLDRFFVREGESWRVAATLRNTVVFSVQDLLSDPPFSKLDLVSCRNLLIYLRPEAQAKAAAIFQFALRPGGILLLGGSETIPGNDPSFEVLSKSDRIYRRLPSDGSPISRYLAGQSHQPRLIQPMPSDRAPEAPRRASEICQKAVLQTYGPATVLINEKSECLYTLGGVDRYLRLPIGEPTRSLLPMAREGLRARLRTSIQQAAASKEPVVAYSDQGVDEAQNIRFRIEVTPVASEGVDYFLVCFIDEPQPKDVGAEASTSTPDPLVARVTRELSETRSELNAAIRELEVANVEHKASAYEALSIQEEFQSTNEELLTSKEELQSLNEELTALNVQLQETLERQRITSDDLQNVLYSTSMATLFLDRDLNIRFFTPATTELFGLIAGDIGRPLADLRSSTDDAALLDDVRSVLLSSRPMDREISGKNDAWFRRRIFPYVTAEKAIEGVVITFDNITEQRQIAAAVERLKLEAEKANLAKSRFLAAASHDLRQPLQTLSLVQELLVTTVDNNNGKRLVARFGETLGAMSGMLNTLLDINQIEAGAVNPAVTTFPVSSLLASLSEEFSYHAHAKNLELRVAISSQQIKSDARLLEQMLRNIVSNALKYTNKGKILIGCRRNKDQLRIEVWDTGIGISERDISRIFEEYQQLGNDARERSKGLGLGLSIVHRLGDLLGHTVEVKSTRNRGSVFSITVPIAVAQRSLDPVSSERLAPPVLSGIPGHRAILLLEDDPALRELLTEFLEQDGHHVRSMANGPDAIAEMKHGAFRPDLILADFNLPGGLDGLEASQRIRTVIHFNAPVIILTGDISSRLMAKITSQGFHCLNKPVKPQELKALIRSVASAVDPNGDDVPRHAPSHRQQIAGPMVYIVDDDTMLREGLREILESEGHEVTDFESCEAFLKDFHQTGEACLLLDATLPGMSGLELLARLRESGHSIPTIMITGGSDVQIAVDAMKAGASDFIEKPVSRQELNACIQRALAQSRDASQLHAWQVNAARLLGGLTARQHQIMDMVLAGHPSKNIAADLGISQRTVENHRAAIMQRTGAGSIPGLARLAVAAKAASDSSN